MQSKQLSIKRMDGADSPPGAKGHHGIFDGGVYVGHVSSGDMRDHLASCMKDGYAGIVAPPIAPPARGQAGIAGHQMVASETSMLAVDREVDRETQKVMDRDHVGYGKAMKLALSENVELSRRYEAAHREEMREDTAPESRSVDDELMSEVTKRRKRDRLSFGEALQRTLADNKDLARRYRDAHR